MILEEVVHAPKMLRERKLPLFTVRGSWRFPREEISRWVDQQDEGTEVGSNE